MDVPTLVRAYPRLYHVAWDGSWPAICRYGLLSARALLEKYRVGNERMEVLTRRRRDHWVTVRGEDMPDAVLRDQKPMTDESVRRALGGKAEPAEWYALLSGLVFFWPTMHRVRTMIGAQAYVGMCHDLLVVDTARLVEEKADAVRLSPMNSGATRPFPHSRSMNLFKTISDYPYCEWKRSRGRRDPIAEVCVEYAVERIRDYVIDVRRVSIETL